MGVVTDALSEIERCNLSGGSSSSSGNVVALAAIMAEWTGINSNASRVTKLSYGVGADGSIKLSGAAVQNGSSAVDRLTVGSESDWFF